MLSKNKIKLIQSLSRKKSRDEQKLFLAEGDKLVLEAVGSGCEIEFLYATKQFLLANSLSEEAARELSEVSEAELSKASLLKSPQQALAVVRMPDYRFSSDSMAGNLSLALDCIQDPGNLGTILRIADWFGIGQLLCSENTADCYNPKVVQSSMGAVFRVKVHYLNLPETLREAALAGLPVFGTFLDGEIIFGHALAAGGILVMGNEGNGISPQVEKLITQRLYIPSFPEGQKNSESLNVAAAAAICCSEFRRRML